jgi:hypothetical protein
MVREPPPHAGDLGGASRNEPPLVDVSRAVVATWPKFRLNNGNEVEKKFKRNFLRFLEKSRKDDELINSFCIFILSPLNAAGGKKCPLSLAQSWYP